MEPEQSMPLPSLAFTLWLVVFVLGIVVALARFAT
jgi:hypothetical protein